MSDHYPIELRIRFTHRTSGPSYDTSGSHVTSTYYETPSDLRVGAFNVRVFGQKKVADADVLDILVQVFQHRLLLKHIFFVLKYPIHSNQIKFIL